LPAAPRSDSSLAGVERPMDMLTMKPVRAFFQVALLVDFASRLACEWEGC
jgi:hypothetical protein